MPARKIGQPMMVDGEMQHLMLCYSAIVKKRVGNKTAKSIVDMFQKKQATFAWMQDLLVATVDNKVLMDANRDAPHVQMMVFRQNAKLAATASEACKVCCSYEKTVLYSCKHVATCCHCILPDCPVCEDAEEGD